MKNNRHRSLCPKQLTKQVDVNIPSMSVVEGSLGAVAEQVIMQTALVKLFNMNKETLPRRSRLLLDCGSQRTYISKYIAEKLQLKEIGKIFLVVHTFGKSKPENIETQIVEIGIRLQSGFTMQLKASVVPNITEKMERQPVKNEIREKLRRFELADTIPTVTESTYIDLLVGNDYYADIVSMQRVTLYNGLYLLKSKLGWVLSGRTQEQPSRENERTMSMLTYSSNRWMSDLTSFSCVDNTVEFKPRLEEFWKLETIGIKDCPFESDDEKALMKFNETIKYEDKRYWLGWRYRFDNPDLPENSQLAYG